MAIPKYEVVIQRQFARPEIIIHADRMPNGKASMAADLASKLAIILAEPDGEDSSGRQKWKVMSAEQVAKRSCDIAEQLFSEMDKRQWFIPVPNWDEVKKIAEAEKKKQLE